MARLMKYEAEYAEIISIDDLRSSVWKNLKWMVRRMKELVSTKKNAKPTSKEWGSSGESDTGQR